MHHDVQKCSAAWGCRNITDEHRRPKSGRWTVLFSQNVWELHKLHLGASRWTNRDRVSFLLFQVGDEIRLSPHIWKHEGKRIKTKLSQLFSNNLSHRGNMVTQTHWGEGKMRARERERGGKRREGGRTELQWEIWGCRLATCENP